MREVVEVLAEAETRWRTATGRAPPCSSRKVVCRLRIVVANVHFAGGPCRLAAYEAAAAGRFD